MLKRTDIYRDSKSWYTEVRTPVVSNELMDFCRRHAGRRVLDLGCAAGDYCVELQKAGFECVGADINEAYVAAARRKGVNAVLAGDRLPFEDDSFDTVIIFEVLEHVQEPEKLLREAKRVSSGNVLITVPDCGGREELARCKLVCEHFLELDHVNFFTEADLKSLLSSCFGRFTVSQGDPILTWRAGLPRWVRAPISVLYRLGLFKARLFSRLYAVAEKR